MSVGTDVTATPPDREALRSLLGDELLAVWEQTCARIDALYDTDRLWNRGYRDWAYEYKYRRGGRSLVALYAKGGGMGVQIIFGRAERERLEQRRGDLSPETLAAYDRANTYHDGKWVMLEPEDARSLPDLEALLALKRRPNRGRLSKGGERHGCES